MSFQLRKLIRLSIDGGDGEIIKRFDRVFETVGKRDLRNKTEIALSAKTYAVKNNADKKDGVETYSAFQEKIDYRHGDYRCGKPAEKIIFFAQLRKIPNPCAGVLLQCICKAVKGK